MNLGRYVRDRGRCRLRYLCGISCGRAFGYVVDAEIVSLHNGISVAECTFHPHQALEISAYTGASRQDFLACKGALKHDPLVQGRFESILNRKPANESVGGRIRLKVQSYSGIRVDRII